MELIDYGPIAQAANKIQSNACKSNFTSGIVIGLVAGLMIGYVICSWQMQQLNMYHPSKE